MQNPKPQIPQTLTSSMNLYVALPPIPDLHVSSLPDIQSPTTKKNRKKGKKKLSIELKIQSLSSIFNPIPFIPLKILDFDKHETLFRSLGLWDFVHIDFDRVIRVDLVSQLIATYDVRYRSGYVNGCRVLVNRTDLGRAFKFRVKREKGEGGFGVLDEVDVGFMVDFVSDWMLLHDDGWVMPDEVVGWMDVVKEGHPERVDWAKFVWFMVEKELSCGEKLRDCYYASHLQYLIKVQCGELFLKEGEGSVVVGTDEGSKEGGDVDDENSEFGEGDGNVGDEIEKVGEGDLFLKEEEGSEVVEMDEEAQEGVHVDDENGKLGEGDESVDDGIEKVGEGDLSVGDEIEKVGEGDVSVGDEIEKVGEGGVNVDDGIEKVGDENVGVDDTIEETGDENCLVLEGSTELILGKDVEKEEEIMEEEMMDVKKCNEMMGVSVGDEGGKVGDWDVIVSDEIERLGEGYENVGDEIEKFGEGDVGVDDAIEETGDERCLVVGLSTELTLCKAGENDEEIMEEEMIDVEKCNEMMGVSVGDKGGKVGEWDVIVSDEIERMGEGHVNVGDEIEKFGEGDVSVNDAIEETGDQRCLVVEPGIDLTLCKDGEKEGEIKELMEVEKCNETDEDGKEEEQGKWLLHGKNNLGDHFMQPCRVENDIGFGSFEESKEDEIEGEEDEDEDGIHVFSNDEAAHEVRGEGSMRNLIHAMEANSNVAFASHEQDMGKRLMELDNNNNSNKRLRMDDSWVDHNKPVDFATCIDHIQQMAERARVCYEEKENASKLANANQQVLLNELHKRDVMIDDIKRTIAEEMQVKDAEIYRYERELYLMRNVLDDYRRGLKGTQKAFAEYRERARLRDLEKLRQKKEEEFKTNCLIVEEKMKEVEAGYVVQFGEFLDKITDLEKKLTCVEAGGKELIKMYAQRKNSRIDEKIIEVAEQPQLIAAQTEEEMAEAEEPRKIWKLRKRRA